jgi:uncharacterized protein
MKRYIQAQVERDLLKKMVFVTGARQAGKTTLSEALISQTPGGQYLNYDVAADRATILAQGWNARAPLLVLDEIHKMPLWKSWLKGVYDGKPKTQHLLVTGSARLYTFRQGGDSLAGRFFNMRLHPIGVKELSEAQSMTPNAALDHIMLRGGFPEPCLAELQDDADRWRLQYVDGLIRADILEFSRIREIGAMRLFLDTLRERVGSPLSLASIARDLNVAPKTLATYLEILEALFIVFVVRPWHKNIARATLQAPKVYFYDIGLVRGDLGVKFENLVACALAKHVDYLYDVRGQGWELHYIRTKDGAEVDFALSCDGALKELIECKLAQPKIHPALQRFAGEFEGVSAIQVVRDLRTERDHSGVKVSEAAKWLAGLAA